MCQTSQVTPQLLAAPRPLIKRQAETTPSGFLKVDIPRFPEPASPHGDTGPATAERPVRAGGRDCLFSIFLMSISCWMEPVICTSAVPYIHTERIPFWLGLVCAFLAVPYIHTEIISFWLELIQISSFFPPSIFRYSKV